MESIISILSSFALPFMASAKDLKLLPDMSTAKVATAEAAVKAVVQKIISDHDGLPSTYGPKTKLSFILGFDVPGFGKQGDRVWQVHLTALTGQAMRIAWVNAEDTTVMFLMEKEKSPNKAIDSDNK
jgi:hypothetical protein